MLLTQLQAFGRSLDWLGDRPDDKDFALGLEALHQARTCQFTDQAALFSAGRHLAHSLRQRPDDAPLCAALAYLTLLRGEERQARYYLKKALHFDPRLQPALELLLYIEEPQTILSRAREEIAELEFSQRKRDETDFDHLHESVQLLIDTSIVQLTLNQHPIPALTDVELAELTHRHDQLNSLLERIRRQLAQLEREIDTSDLHARLTPLEALIRRYQQAIGLSGRFRDLLAEINRLRLRARLLMQHFKMLKESDLAIFYTILDGCEALADRLDELNGLGVDIQPVESVYLDLISYVGQLQDLFDEA